MALSTFNGETYVAFTDISGFKEMMKSGDRAVKALDIFYESGYRALREESSINGLFISDCGILFAKSGSDRQRLEAMLRVLKRINRDALRKGIMLTSSIVWGHFSYHSRDEFPGIGKQPIYGEGYLSAFMDNESGSPRIQPGQCRIVKNNRQLPRDIEQRAFIEETKLHYLYYWHVSTPEEISQFKQSYSDSYSLKYSGMIRALKGAPTE